MRKKTRSLWTTYLWRRIAILTGMIVSVIAITIVCVCATTEVILKGTSVATEGAALKETPTATEEAVPEETPAATEMVVIHEINEEAEEVIFAEVTSSTEKVLKVPKESITATEMYMPEIKLFQDNISEWCMSFEEMNAMTLWKMTDDEGNLLISLKDSEEKFVAVFKYEGLECSNYEEWILCEDVFIEITTSDIIDLAFTSYHEVGGKNSENVQAQIAVLINRKTCEGYPDTVRKVITDPYQYSCAKNVLNRRMKSDNQLEYADLEKCFRQVILVLAGETIQEVPSDVIYAARGSQGSGIWKIIDGTYYCYR